MDLNNIIITDVLSVVTVHSPKGRFHKVNNRQSFGLSFTDEGKITYTHAGKQFVSDKNHAVILPKSKSYTLSGDREGLFPLINFECDGFLADTIIVLPVKNAEAVIKEFEHMKNLFLNCENRLMLLSSFYKIFHELLRAQNHDQNPLAPALKFIESNYFKDITNEMLAKKCYISEEYFRKQFAKIYGLPPKQYIINMRISKAKQMLTEGILKIGAISEQCGFQSPYHFCRMFRQKTGMSPSEFMKQNKIYKL